MTCSNHGEYKAKKLTYGKNIIWSGCQECIEAQDRRERDADKKPITWLSRRREGLTLDNYAPPNIGAVEIVEKIRSYCANFGKPGKVRDRGTSLCFVGQPGTGKTHLACAMAVNIHNQGFLVSYRRHHEIMYQIKETYSAASQESEKVIIKNLTNVDLLVIDEIGLNKKLSDTDLELTYKILDARYDSMKPTVLVSNLSEQGLGECLGPRTIDRMYENHGTVFVFDWGSYRRVKA